MEKPTHTLRANPQMSVARLADYMAASEQAKRGVVQSCKYRPIARITQHRDARAVVSAAIAAGPIDVKALNEKAEYIRNKLADGDFENEQNGHNADYIERFAEVSGLLALPVSDISAGQIFPTRTLNGVQITFALNASLQRVTRTNRVRSGGVMLRYKKGVPLARKVGEYQSAFVFGRLMELADLNAAEPEQKLCVTIDAHEAICHEAPTNSIYLFNEMKAGCLAIAERWAAIKAPPNAIIAP